MQRPPVHGTPLQQGCVAEHACPYCAHGVVVPASGGGVGAEPHVPFVEPVGTMQGRPEQQSALMVQPPAAGTHAASHLPLTQGLPQQSALVAQS